MTVIERRAWFVLGVCLVAIVAVAAIFALTGKFTPAMGAMGLLGLTGATPLIGRRQKQRGEIIIDERDRAILQTAGRFAFGTFWVALVGAVMGLFALAGDSASLRVGMIVSALWFAFLLINIVHSSSVLWMCRSQHAR
jgi:hypothetical protein